jgi:hypothetical protein
VFSLPLLGKVRSNQEMTRFGPAKALSVSRTRSRGLIVVLATRRGLSVCDRKKANKVQLVQSKQSSLREQLKYLMIRRHIYPALLCKDWANFSCPVVERRHSKSVAASCSLVLGSQRKQHNRDESSCESQGAVFLSCSHFCYC